MVLTKFPAVSRKAWQSVKAQTKDQKFLRGNCSKNVGSELRVWEQKKNLFPPGFEPGTSRVLGERDNHYTTETLHNTGVSWFGDIH